jgi:hypothetical protein
MMGVNQSQDCQTAPCAAGFAIMVELEISCTVSLGSIEAYGLTLLRHSVGKHVGDINVTLFSRNFVDAGEPSLDGPARHSENERLATLKACQISHL